MKKISIAAGIIIGIGCLYLTGVPSMAAEKKGEALFKQHCAVCHPNGGNIINPKKTLHKSDRDVNGVKTAADIIKKMRNPGPGMTKFNQQAVSNKDAHEIAEYILKTF